MKCPIMLKTAVGPKIFMSENKYAPTGAVYSYKGNKIIGNVGRNTLPWTKGTDKNRVITHELTHWLRNKKGTWGSKHYGKLMPATFIEEMAAYRRSGTGLGRSIQGSAWTALMKAKKNKPMNRLIAKAVKLIK